MLFAGAFIRMVKISFTAVFVAAIVLGSSLWGCSKKEDGKTFGESASKAVIQIDDHKIDARVVETYLERRTLPVNTGNAGELLKKRIDEIIMDELLYHEALRLKIDQDPEVRQKIREVLKQKITEDQIHKKVMDRKIDPSELQSYYNAHFDEFVRPEEVRVADVFIAVPKNINGEGRTELKKKAEKVLKEALTGSNSRNEFNRLVREYSDTPETHAKGDTGFFNPEGKPGGLDPRLVDAAFKLRNSGDIAQSLIEAGDGYHIIMLLNRRPAINKPFDQVADYLQRRIKNEEITKKRDEYYLGLKTKAKIVVDEKAIVEIQAKLQAERKMQGKISE